MRTNLPGPALFGLEGLATTGHFSTLHSAVPLNTDSPYLVDLPFIGWAFGLFPDARAIDLWTLIGAVLAVLAPLILFVVLRRMSMGVTIPLLMVGVVTLAFTIGISVVEWQDGQVMNAQSELLIDALEGSAIAQTGPLNHTAAHEAGSAIELFGQTLSGMVLSLSLLVQLLVSGDIA